MQEVRRKDKLINEMNANEDRVCFLGIQSVSFGIFLFAHIKYI